MTLAEALNILREAEFYASHNLARPTFYDLPDGKVGINFFATRADGRQFGMNRFESLADLNAFIAGREAVRHEAEQDAFDAEEAARAVVKAQQAAQATAGTSYVLPGATASTVATVTPDTQE